jgi:putative transposase
LKKEALVELRQSQTKLSLNQLSKLTGIPVWKYRHAQNSLSRENAKTDRLEQEKVLVKNMALEKPTLGYRLLHKEIVLEGNTIAIEKVRLILKDLGLATSKRKKPARDIAKVTPVTEWGSGRRIQIDATQVQINSERYWVYIVIDVDSRYCLAALPVKTLSKEDALRALEIGLKQLETFSSKEPILLQSDGGSDFTSQHMQDGVKQHGTWVRAKVNQKGGMGILERLNRTFKYEHFFRLEVSSMKGLRECCALFLEWYNTKRRHTSIGYVTPQEKLEQLANQAKTIPSEVC